MNWKDFKCSWIIKSSEGWRGEQSGHCARLTDQEDLLVLSVRRNKTPQNPPKRYKLKMCLHRFHPSPPTLPQTATEEHAPQKSDVWSLMTTAVQVKSQVKPKSRPSRFRTYILLCCEIICATKRKRKKKVCTLQRYTISGQSRIKSQCLH